MARLFRKSLDKRLLSKEHQLAEFERQSMLLGRMASDHVKQKSEISSLADVEFRVFSQFGDDGIIQWLIHCLDIPSETFIEFGVEDYRESNTRFLMMQDNWSGLIMDGSVDNVKRIESSTYYWRHELQAKAVFVDRENINELIAEAGFEKDVGILHIDIDGNDYWIWKSIDVISPVIVIMEFNSVFEIDRPITIPYDKGFVRGDAHYSFLYFGASLGALHHLAGEKGYAFVGCNSAGNNAYFVRKDKLTKPVREISLDEGYVVSKFRESRNESGQMDHVAGKQRIELIRGLPVVNVQTGQVEKL